MPSSDTDGGLGVVQSARKAREVQEHLLTVSSQLCRDTYDGAVPGQCHVVVDGHGTVTRITLDPSVAAMLGNARRAQAVEDALVKSVNMAVDKSREKLADKIKQATTSMPVQFF